MPWEPLPPLRAHKDRKHEGRHMKQHIQWQRREKKNDERFIRQKVPPLAIRVVLSQSSLASARTTQRIRAILQIPADKQNKPRSSKSWEPNGRKRINSSKTAPRVFSHVVLFNGSELGPQDVLQTVDQQKENPVLLTVHVRTRFSFRFTSAQTGLSSLSVYTLVPAATCRRCSLHTHHYWESERRGRETRP